jgi:large subunit ribosomal protein L23
MDKKKTTKEKKVKDVEKKRVGEIPAMAIRNIIQRPFISEKAQRLYGDDSYTFLVHPDANKKMVREEVERRYGVNVISLTMTSIKGKVKRFRYWKQERKGVKKAVVKVKKGQKIEII